jgi:hypothetical protein
MRRQVMFNLWNQYVQVFAVDVIPTVDVPSIPIVERVNVIAKHAKFYRVAGCDGVTG